MVTPDDTIVIIPHQVIWNTSLHNANDGAQDLMCIADFYVVPEHDASQVRHMLKDIAATSPYLHNSRPINVIVAERPWGTHYRLKAYPIDARDQFLFTSDLTVRGKQVLAEAGIKTARSLPVVTEG